MQRSLKMFLMILIISVLLFSFTWISVIAESEDITVQINTGISVTLQADNDGYYMIGNTNELYAFAVAVNGGKSGINGKLTSDIIVNTNVLSNSGTSNNDLFSVWTPIGTQSIAYNGTFDGNGHTIYGLYLNNQTQNYVGLFGNLGKQGYIHHIEIQDSFFSAHNYVGAIVGNCSGNISDCYNTGNVIGSERVGGIVGYMVMGAYGNISNCYNTGDILGEHKVGGIAGEQAGLELKNCYNTGNVSGTNDVGGIAGHFYCYYITNSYNIGNVNGITNVGPLVGYQYPGSLNIKAYLKNSYYLSDIRTESGGRTKEDFVSGEIAYLLGNAFGQKLSGEGTDFFPVFTTESNHVYTYKCCGTKENYSNEEISNPSIVYENGFCSYCGAIGKLTEENYKQLGFTEENYSKYLGYAVIQNADNLYWLADYLKDGYREINIVLAADITVNTNVLNSEKSLNEGSFRVWIPITEYNGIFDGNGKKINGLYYSGNRDRVGLFAMLGKEAQVKNLTITDSYFKGNDYVGGIVGYNLCGEITNCANIGTVIGNKYVGGIIGHNNYTYERDRYGYTTAWFGILKNSYHCGTVNGNEYVGGVVGVNTGGMISDCYHMGTVEGNNTIGGVIGYNQGIGEFGMADQQPYNLIEKCYNTGNVIGNYEVGGVIGNNNATDVIDCHNVGNVQGIESVGGVIGVFEFGTLICPSNSGEVLGERNVGNFIGSGYVVDDGHIDADNDHKCDTCLEESVGKHIDENLDHKCDYGCSAAFGEHLDSDKNHICDYGCSLSMGVHVDTNKDHTCDYGCSTKIGEHSDSNKDHICDYGCAITIGNHIDSDKNHICDHGCTDNFGEHTDNDNDHICDYGCSVTFGEHLDSDENHICDYGCSSAIGNHFDANKDHACDYGCSTKIGEHSDSNKDHICDYGCAMILGNHIDENKDHKCDYGCLVSIGEHIDLDNDNSCDYGCKYLISIENDNQTNQLSNYLVAITLICSITSLISVSLVIYLIFRKKVPPKN